MLRKSGIILVMLIAVAILVTASASAASEVTKQTGNNGWVVTQGDPSKASSVVFTSVGTSSSSSMMASSFSFTPGVNYIISGQTSYSSSYIQSSPGFTVDLNWGNSANSLQLTIFCADGSVLGPYYDSADTRADGRICLNFYKTDGSNIPAGIYYAKVYGYHVTGIQSYTI
jgi:hypothetical protein